MAKYDLYKIADKTKTELTEIIDNYHYGKYSYEERQALNTMLKMIYQTLKNINNSKKIGDILK